MRKIVIVCLSLLSLLLAGSCRGHSRDSHETEESAKPPPPNPKSKPAGEGWWCVISPDVKMSCRRTQEDCEFDRNQAASEEFDPPPCTKVDTASCLTFRPGGKGIQVPFCQPTTEKCQATRKQLLGSKHGHTMISGCETWK